jgi:hypothetical protein
MNAKQPDTQIEVVGSNHRGGWQQPSKWLAATIEMVASNQQYLFSLFYYLLVISLRDIGIGVTKLSLVAICLTNLLRLGRKVDSYG